MVQPPNVVDFTDKPVYDEKYCTFYNESITKHTNSEFLFQIELILAKKRMFSIKLFSPKK